MSYTPPYARQPEPIAGARDYARALQSGELFRAWSGERIGQNLDPIVEDILQSQMSLHRVLARAVGLPEGLTAGEVYARMIGTGDLAALIVPGRVELIQAQFSPWVARFMKLFKRIPVTNFNDLTVYSLGVSSPQPMTEFAEFKFGSVTTPTPLETIGLTSNGIAWLLSRHVTINGHTQLMDAMEAAIAATFAAYLRSALATALAAADTLEDGSAFFNSGAGNLGAPPKPPWMGSNSRARPTTASSRNAVSGSGASPDARPRAIAAMRPVACSAWAMTSSRRSR